MFLWLLDLRSALQCPACSVGLSQSMAEGSGSPGLEEASVAEPQLCPCDPESRSSGSGTRPLPGGAAVPPVSPAFHQCS